jgi:hypothetical protein
MMSIWRLASVPGSGISHSTLLLHSPNCSRDARNRQWAIHCSLLIHHCSFVIWAHPRASAGSGFPLQFLSPRKRWLAGFPLQSLARLPRETIAHALSKARHKAAGGPLRGSLVRLSPIPSRRRRIKPLAAPCAKSGYRLVFIVVK